jgi:hypothetical protein
MKKQAFLTEEEIMRHEKRKFWVSADGQSEIGSWPATTSDKDVFAELLAECNGERAWEAGILAGKIVQD